MSSGFHRLLSHVVNDELSYTVSRSYPYGRLFKLCVFIVSILLLGGLTVLNFATNGFDKQVSYTSDPNTTVAQLRWYNHPLFTWGDDTLEPKCESTEIPIGHEVLTTNFGLRYRVEEILAPDGKPRASVSYHNNTLNDCEIQYVGISLQNTGLAPPSRQYRWAPWIPSTADALAHCNITTDEGQFRLALKTNYITAIDSFNFLAMNDPRDRASLWWGARLLNLYFVGTQYVVSGPLPDNDDNTPMYTRARLSYETYPGSNETSIKHPGQMFQWFYFLEAETGVRETSEAFPWITNSEMLYNNASWSKSRPQTEGLFFAKVMRSVVLADLGNSVNENLILEPDLLKWALDPGVDNFNRIENAPLAHNESNPDWWKFGGISPPDEKHSAQTAIRMSEAYDSLSPSLGPLGTKSATINTVYTCSVPEKKSTSTIFVLVLVANLALFQTAWSLFRYCLDQWATWKDEKANYCEGCVQGYRAMAMRDGEYSPSTPGLFTAMSSPDPRFESTRMLLSPPLR